LSSIDLGRAIRLEVRVEKPGELSPFYLLEDEIAAVSCRNRNSGFEDGNRGLCGLSFEPCENRGADHGDEENRNERRADYSAVCLAIRAVK
jgi:hypothetical protein